MLRTSSGERPGGGPVGTGSGLACWLATIPGAMLVLGTRRGRPAWVTRSPASGTGGGAAAGGASATGASATGAGRSGRGASGGAGGGGGGGGWAIRYGG
jgi:hypothetical protein